MIDVPQAYREIIREAVLAEIAKRVPTNRLYAYCMNALGELNGRNSEMDTFSASVYLFARVKADEAGQSIQATIPFIITQIVEAKAVTMAMRQPNIDGFLSNEERVWVADKVKQAQSITSSVELWLHNHPDVALKQKNQTQGAASPGAFRRSVPRKCAALFASAKDVSNATGAMPFSEGTVEEPQYDANGIFIPRSRRTGSARRISPDRLDDQGHFKTQPLRKAFRSMSNSLSTANMAPLPEAPIAPEVDLDPPIITRKFNAVPRRVQVVEDDGSSIMDTIANSTIDVTIPASDPTPAATVNEVVKEYRNHSPKPKQQKDGDRMIEQLCIVSNADFEESKLNYQHHQLYKSFAIKPAAPRTPTRADFMGALLDISLTTQSDYEKMQAEDSLPEILFVWHEQIGSAMCTEHSVIRTANALVEAKFIPGIDGHFAYNFDRYESLKTFSDKDSLEIFLEEHPTLAKLFDNAFERPLVPLSLGTLHAALKALKRDTATASIVEILNQRLTKRVNFALKYEMLSTFDIDDFIDDFEELVKVIAEHLGDESLIPILTGEINDGAAAGVYIPASCSNLVYNLPAEVAKQWNQVINTTKKDVAMRTLFLVERHCVGCIAANFNSNIAVSAVPNKWSEFRYTASAELWMMMEMLYKQQDPSEAKKIARYHLMFADGITVEFRPTELNLLDDTVDEGVETKRVYMARIVDNN